MQVFNHAVDKDGSERNFQAWRKAHQKGFVINHNGPDMLLHFADCWHFYGETAGVNNTKKPKICSTNRAELERWASAHGVDNLTGCKTCKLD